MATTEGTGDGRPRPVASSESHPSAAGDPWQCVIDGYTRALAVTPVGHPDRELLHALRRSSCRIAGVSPLAVLTRHAGER